MTTEDYIKSDIFGKGNLHMKFPMVLITDSHCQINKELTSVNFTYLKILDHLLSGEPNRKKARITTGKHIKLCSLSNMK